MADSDAVQIRVATLDDAPALGRMHVASWRETYAGILPEQMLASLSIEDRAAMWDRIMREPATLGSTVVYLAERGGSIIGFGSCGAQRTENLKTQGYDGEFSAIYVLRAFQGQGIGARLLTKMSLDLAGRGFSAAALWVLRKNLIARRFYEHKRGQVIAEREEMRDGAVLIELAYGWRDLKELDRLKRHHHKVVGGNGTSILEVSDATPDWAVRIEYLADHPDNLREVAALHLGEWPSPELGDSIDARDKTLSVCCRRGEIPLGVIALDREELCGFALLVLEDFELRPNLSPWLAGVFVRPQHRKRGVGSALVTRIENEAKAMAVNTIYLYTAHSESLYGRLGWKVVERCFHNDRNYAVMAKAL